MSFKPHDSPHDELRRIIAECTIKVRRAKDERERYFFQGKKDMARIALILFAKTEDNAETAKIWQESSIRYNTPKDRYTRAEMEILE